MKTLYLKSYKCLLSQTHRVRNDFFGYKRYEALAQHIKSFLKNIKVKGRQCPDYKENYCGKYFYEYFEHV